MGLNYEPHILAHSDWDLIAEEEGNGMDQEFRRTDKEEKRVLGIETGIGK